jgi:transposase
MGPLSGDLRKRVVSAVHEEGMSCRAAARRFGVSFSSSIRWVAALRERGSYAPLPMGGDTRSQRLEAHADFLLGLHRREPDLTLNEICDRLELGRGVSRGFFVGPMALPAARGHQAGFLPPFSRRN